MSEAAQPDPVIELCSSCGQQMDVTQFEPFAEVTCSCGTETRVKQVFGNYHLQRRYAVGGMSVVFIAWDTTLNREVAVKILNEEYSIDGSRVEQFENEARLTAAVHNPHVVQIYTVGKAYGRFYLVMELLEGRSFELIMKERGALPEAEVLDIGRQVIEGLSAANNAGVIHRDVKPGNILIDSAGLVKLVDFGLALITQGGKAQAEEIWATPYYVPPEVLDRGVEDFRSDLYALGATLYHALAGHPPFEATSTQTKFLKEKKKVIPKLNRAASWLKESTCEAIDRMMAYESKNRTGSYREALALIDLAVAEAAESGVIPIHGQSRAKRRGRRKKVALIQAGVGLLALAGVGFVGLKLFGEKPPEPVSDQTAINVPGVVVPVDTPSQVNQGQTEFLAKAWKRGRKAVTDRDFRMAEIQFAKISKDRTVPEPTRSWAELEGILSRYLGGTPGKAREAAAKMHKRLRESGGGDAVTVGLKKVARELSQMQPVAERVFPSAPKNVVEWMSCLALSMKNWEQGLFQETVPRLKQIKSADLGGEFEWFSIYRLLIEDYLQDAALLSGLNTLPDPKTEAEAHEQVMDLNTRFGKLKTGGRAKFNVRARQAWLARKRKGFEIRPGDASVTPWVEVKEMLQEPIKARDFREVRAILEENQLSGPANARWALDYLSKNAEAFQKDLDGLFGIQLQIIEGPFVSIKQVSKNGMTLDNGKHRSWRVFDTSSLIKVHDKLREKAAGERAVAMREHAISYAWFCDLRAFAEFDAEKFAKENSEFAKRWKRVVIGVSE